MTLHTQAALTVRQRQLICRLHFEEKVSIRKLAKQFKVNPSTIQRWLHRESPLDHTSAPIHHRTVVTPEYRAAVIDYRREHPNHGPIRISQELAAQFPWANRGTILPILREAELIGPARKKDRERKSIPVGYHRIQMDIQQLPAVKGGQGFEYKISAIHLRTRVKYSEIHPNFKSKTVAGVLRRALDLLPPFSSSGPTTDLSSP